MSVEINLWDVVENYAPPGFVLNLQKVGKICFVEVRKMKEEGQDIVENSIQIGVDFEVLVQALKSLESMVDTVELNMQLGKY